MPLLYTAYPRVLNSFYGPSPPKRPFLIYYASIDPATGQMWCPDCRAVESTVKDLFEKEDGPTGLIIWVGQRAEWKDPNNQYRKEAGITGVPTIVKLKDGKEVARLVEYNILDKDKLSAFMKDD
ncbi:thioredoxin-like protein [Calocera cornea HHB12733]|uniref:Thioredoxin-like protein n=1 Tax=Calocera cornea HHB12733 TaxID=1353952 RepID=A0A165K2G1_9BASI|nr:thioredoxin-like protein [Calocera cornea HHB12733]